jgi:hypothetical protein
MDEIPHPLFSHSSPRFHLDRRDFTRHAEKLGSSDDFTELGVSSISRLQKKKRRGFPFIRGVHVWLSVIPRSSSIAFSAHCCCTIGRLIARARAPCHDYAMYRFVTVLFPRAFSTTMFRDIRKSIPRYV